jgi:DnaK suppressor protein
MNQVRRGSLVCHARTTRQEGMIMDNHRATELLNAERTRVQGLLDELQGESESNREAVNDAGDMSNASESLVTEGLDDAVVYGLNQRLAAIDRAEQRIEAGTYGRSTLSGDVIPDERLEADPAAELTVDEARTSS